MNRRRAEYPMLVQPVKGEGLVRFWVSSQSTPNTRYLVDLSAWYGNGWCGCPAFAGYYESGRIRNEKHLTLKDVAKPNYKFTDVFRCKHIKAARTFLGREFVDIHLQAVQKLHPKTDEL